jgi:hypothetical protein
MKHKTLLVALGLAATLAACNSAPAEPMANSKIAASATAPVVVELFQSQGCSSCPPANAALNLLADHEGVIALSFAVTYWDHLGWKDSFATPAYTQRQRNYNSALHGDGVYTPQVVLNGARAIVGNGKGELAGAVAKTAGLSGGPAISASNAMVHVGKGSGKANVWLVRYDPRVRDVAINAGENGGRTLPHRNIVRQLVKLGGWSGAAADYPLPKTEETGLRTAILVQRSDGGAIYSAKLI